MIRSFSHLSAFAFIVWSVFSVSLAQVLPLTIKPGPIDDPDLGDAGTFLPYQFDPQYGASNVDERTGLVGGSGAAISVGTQATGVSADRDSRQPSGKLTSMRSGDVG